MWSISQDEATLRFTLPRAYNRLFERREGVEIALRLVGNRLAPIRIRDR
jgi:hypothetical protein